MAAQPESIAIPDIESFVRPTHDERARQSMVSMIRKLALGEMRTELKRDYDERVAPALVAAGREPRDWRDIERAMEPELSYRLYSTFRYHSQEMGYLSVQSAVERALPGMIALARDLAERCPRGGSLRLDPARELPRYLTALDVHLAPGSFQTEYTADDVAQGAVVSCGAGVFLAHNAFRRRSGAVGDSISHWIRRTRPDFAPRRVLDMATTSGKNLLPYQQAFPDAELHGIDLGAPVLRYGHALAQHAGVPVHFSQQDASATDFPDGHFDLIVSTFFLHEIPLKLTRQVLRECRRLLAPGGLMVHMELPNEAAVGAYENFFFNWDTANNNEPFYTGYREQDPRALCAEAGFDPAGIFTAMVPERVSFGEERYARYLRGEIAAPPHGTGAWFVFGASR